MSLLGLMVRPVAILSPGVRTDAFGDSQPTWDSPTEVDVEGWLSQEASIQNLDGRRAASTTKGLTLPAGTPITFADRVRIDGIVYKLTGQPTSAWTPRGEHHMEVQLEVVTG